MVHESIHNTTIIARAVCICRLKGGHVGTVQGLATKLSTYAGNRLVISALFCVVCTHYTIFIVSFIKKRSLSFHYLQMLDLTHIFCDLYSNINHFLPNLFQNRKLVEPICSRTYISSRPWLGIIPLASISLTNDLWPFIRARFL